MQSERHRVRQALDRRQQTHGHKQVVLLSQTATTSPAQFVTGVRRAGSPIPFTLGTQSHIPALMAAMVGPALALGPEWEKARLPVDSGSEHPSRYEPTVFATRDMPRLAPHRQWDLDITEVEGARPVAGRPYPVAPQYLPELNRQIAVLEEVGIIRRSQSLYGAPVLFAPKKDGRLRLCIDYRKLNRQTLQDCYPTPVATDLIARIRGARMFSQLDLHSGFHQLRIREGDQHKTAFVTPEGQYEWVPCPFGLSNTPSYFQRLMNDILHDHIATGYCVCYCDNLLICTESDDPVEHLLKLTAVLDTLREHDLLVKGSKTKFFRKEVEFFWIQNLSSRLGAYGIQGGCIG